MLAGQSGCGSRLPAALMKRDSENRGDYLFRFRIRGRGAFRSRFCNWANLVAGIRTFRTVFREEFLLPVMWHPTIGGGKTNCQAVHAGPFIIFDLSKNVTIDRRFPVRISASGDSSPAGRKKPRGAARSTPGLHTETKGGLA